MRSLVFILIVSMVWGCSPQRRLNRLVKNHPELLQLDTIRVVDTIVVENFTYDTTTLFYSHDTTTVIDNSKIILKYFYDTLTREIFHDVTCVGDTIYYEKLIPIERVVIKELTWWQKYGSIIIIGCFLIVFLLLLKRFGKILL